MILKKKKDISKWMNNAVYGQTLANVRDHVDFEFIDNITRLEKRIHSPTDKHRHIIIDKWMGIEKQER